ncbi:MAG: hydantoinase/oxoprolinase N-terminal domain-containing protein, partial [Pseudobdellovibrionaceae bacterium]
MAQAETDVNLALYVGESFVDAHLSRNQKSIHFSRWYLGKEGFKNGLQKFFQEAGVTQVSKAHVASRFVEKILTYRLGSSVATLTTQGFESWPSIRQPLLQKVGPLSSTDLVFSLQERCTAQGEILQEVSSEEIAEVVKKLRQKQAKRICIHLLNAYKNPHNQNKIKEALVNENFEVFTPEFDAENTDEVSDEISRWRKNILNASLSGTFEEVQEELNAGLKAFLPEGQRALFLSADATLFDHESNQRLSSLWGAYGAWATHLKRQRSDKFNLLYLGLEQFSLLNPENIVPTWNSPWGIVHAPQVQNQLLCLQPTTAIELSP